MHKTYGLIFHVLNGYDLYMSYKTNIFPYSAYYLLSKLIDQEIIEQKRAFFVDELNVTEYCLDDIFLYDVKGAGYELILLYEYELSKFQVKRESEFVLSSFSSATLFVGTCLEVIKRYDPKMLLRILPHFCDIILYAILHDGVKFAKALRKLPKELEDKFSQLLAGVFRCPNPYTLDDLDFYPKDDLMLYISYHLYWSHKPIRPYGLLVKKYHMLKKGIVGDYVLAYGVLDRLYFL